MTNGMGKTKKKSRAALSPGIGQILKRLHYPLDVIPLCVRWYVAYSLSLRNLEEMMAERGIEVDHSSVHRWVIKLVLLFEKAFRRHKRPVSKSWRMDETYVKVKSHWKYWYRAVDKEGNTIDFLLRAHRDKAAARRYFERAIAQNGEPETVIADKSGANLAALEALNAGRQTPIRIRQNKYLNKRHRAGSSRHQTRHQADDGLQAFPVCAHHSVRHRGDAYDSQRADAARWRHQNRCRAILFSDYVSNPIHIKSARTGFLIATKPSELPCNPHERMKLRLPCTYTHKSVFITPPGHRVSGQRRNRCGICGSRCRARQRAARSHSIRAPREPLRTSALAPDS